MKPELWEFTGEVTAEPHYDEWKSVEGVAKPVEVYWFCVWVDHRTDWSCTAEKPDHASGCHWAVKP